MWKNIEEEKTKDMSEGTDQYMGAVPVTSTHGLLSLAVSVAIWTSCDVVCEASATRQGVSLMGGLLVHT